MPVSRRLWSVHGFKSSDDFELLFRAKKCARCGDPLHKYARYRLHNADGTWSDHVVCPPCKDVCGGVLGFDTEGHQGFFEATLF